LNCIQLRKPALDLSDVVRQPFTLITEHPSECISGTVAGSARPRGRRGAHAGHVCGPDGEFRPVVRRQAKQLANYRERQDSRIARNEISRAALAGHADRLDEPDAELAGDDGRSNKAAPRYAFALAYRCALLKADALLEASSISRGLNHPADEDCSRSRL
jgi:hypothetical protein